MSVPADIRAVERPKNTIVENTGRPGPKQYPVRERAGSKYVPGGNPQPHNGRVIGHIIDFRFVPLQQRASPDGPGMLSYGASAFVKSLSDDVYQDLLAVFDAKEACAMMAIATLQILFPRISIHRYATNYEKTFVCQYYPGIPISSGSVTDLLKRIGQDQIKRQTFFGLRLKSVCAAHHIAIDGSLIQDTSRVNDLSAFSRKFRINGCKDISLLYAYDIEKMEPVCAQVFPGNVIDASVYATFIRDNGIDKGIIVADKGFPAKQIEDELKQRPQLHFLNPIKRNDSRIAKHKMYEFEGVIAGIDSQVLFKKKAIGNGKFLYSFRDAGKSAMEEKTFLQNAKKDDEFDPKEYFGKRDGFGSIVFESDQDLPAKVIYSCYADRWMLELVFRQYKSIEGLDCTNVQSDFAVLGSEFINFLATLITCRMVRKAERLGLLDDRSFGDLMQDLGSAWRLVDAPSTPASDDLGWVHTTKKEFETLEALELSTPAPKPQTGKPGRPRIKPEFVGPKRSRGRPRKIKPTEESLTP